MNGAAGLPETRQEQEESDPPPHVELPMGMQLPPEPYPEPEPEAQSLATCEICFEEWADHDPDRWPWRSACPNHRYCSTCLVGFLCEKISTHDVLDITCPGPGCLVEMKAQDVRRILNNQSTKESVVTPTEEAAEEEGTPGQLAKYETLLALAENPRSAACPLCATVSVPAGRRSHAVECTGCGLEFCAIHGDAHLGRSCRQFEKATRKATRANEKFIARTNKIAPCPRCRVNIEKNAGCPHMRCTQCNCSFCWCCGRDYTTHAWHDGNIFLCPAELWGGDNWGPTRLWAARTLHVVLTPVALGLALTAASVALVAAPPVLLGRKVQRHRRRAEQERYRLATAFGRTGSLALSEANDDRSFVRTGSMSLLEANNGRPYEGRIPNDEWPVFRHTQHDSIGTEWSKRECFSGAKQRGREDYRSSFISVNSVHSRHQRWLRHHCMVGALVEARYPPNGNYYQARVSKLLGCLEAPNCYVEVEWDDGDHQYTARPASEIRPRLNEAAVLLIQQRWRETQRDPMHEAAALLISDDV